MADNPFGWDLLYNSIKNDVKSNQDLLVSLVHFTLVSNGFKCIGLGESKVLTGDELKSETLPEGWRDNYAIRYIYQGVLYNLKGTILDDAIMVNLIRTDERNVSFIQLNTRAVVKRSGSLNEMMPDYPAMIDVIKKQLIDKVITSKKARDSATQTAPSQSVGEVPRGTTSNSPMHPSNLFEDRDYQGESFGRFLDPVGRNDLNPFGVDPLRITRPNRNSGTGGGMLFQPPGGFGPTHPLPPGMPPGAVPPGARFDPFRPPDVDHWTGRRTGRRSDNDEFPPPGYDDMFM